MIFSDRLSLSEEAVKWCKENKCEISPLGIVCALNALDALKQPDDCSHAKRGCIWWADV